MEELGIIERDHWLLPYKEIINDRHRAALRKEQELTANSGGSLSDFATGHLYFGLHKSADGWILREWAPNATAIYLLTDSNGWQKSETYAFAPKEHGEWELRLPADALRHGNHYKLYMVWDGGEGERIPAWATYVTQDPDTHLFSATVWDPREPYVQKHPRAVINDEPLLIYEAHIGMATEEERVGTYREFQETVLPKVAEKGYNALQLMAIMEHPYYGSFGYHVSNFFAPSSRFGTPDELRELIDQAHALGLVVIMDIVHSHAVKNEVEGIALYDGTATQFFHAGDRGEHPQWNSKCFDYGKNEVLHFLLSNCKYWMEQFGFDGYRFDGVTSMLYFDHGLNRNFCTYKSYYDGQEDADAITYLTLANKLIHEVYPHALTIAEEVSGMPGIALPVSQGGYGFDYRLAMNIPDFWIKLIKEQPDEYWNTGAIWWESTNRRQDEKSISYAESHDQALVGDKTLIFRLIDWEMYWHMDRADDNETVSRGIALHKMIRMVTLTTINGGYLNFMGNEFGHPEWIDFPREGNDWSHKYARRQWSLEENGFLKYGQLGDFDKELISFTRSEVNFQELPLIQIWDKQEDQVLAYERGDYLFVYNFHPTKSVVDYRIPAPQGKYTTLLSTDEKRFGGYDLVDKSVEHFTLWDPELNYDGRGWLSLYIPARTAFILKKCD
ncbi:MAG: alpha amylase C-terminal domain-containing protein [Porphyromonas sp.]|nr:alpha amylase C-terminal domain-containing protein [Porphyromonas sp.]